MAIQNQIEPNALSMALDYISNKMEMKDVYLNERYGLNRCSLSKIRKGEDIPRAHQYYLHSFVRILNERRLWLIKSHDFEKAKVITVLLCDMLLAEHKLLICDPK